MIYSSNLESEYSQNILIVQNKLFVRFTKDRMIKYTNSLFSKNTALWRHFQKSRKPKRSSEFRQLSHLLFFIEKYHILHCSVTSFGFMNFDHILYQSRSVLVKSGNNLKLFLIVCHKISQFRVQSINWNKSIFFIPKSNFNLNGRDLQSRSYFSYLNKNLVLKC